MLRMVGGWAWCPIFAARVCRSNQTTLLVFVPFVLWCVCVKRGPTAGSHFRRGCPRYRSFRRSAWHPLMIQAKPTIVELDMDELEEILRRLDAKELGADDYEKIGAAIGSYVYLVHAVGAKDTTIRRLRQMLFGAKTEKTEAVIGDRKDAGRAPPSPADTGADESAKADTQTSGEAPTENDSQTSGEAPKGYPGRGRNGADACTGAEKIEVRHESLQPGDSCPKCEDGTLYDTGRPGVLVRLVGQAPVGAKVYYLQKLRCNLCGVVFAAEPPAGVDAEEKYDPTVGSMIALLKYGSGMPFKRAENLQENLGIPLPASTQWDIVEAQAERAGPVFEELVRQAAQGDVVYNDDTGVKILEVMGERARQAALAEDTADDTVKGSVEDPSGAASEGPAENSAKGSVKKPGPVRRLKLFGRRFPNYDPRRTCGSQSAIVQHKRCRHTALRKKGGVLFSIQGRGSGGVLK